MSDALGRGARAAVRCLGVGPSDEVLIVCNEPQRGIADALAAAAAGLARSVDVMPYPAAGRPSEEPPGAVAAAMAAATVVLAPTSYSLSHTRARQEATAGGTRIATLPRVTLDMVERLIDVDYEQLRRSGSALAACLDAAAACRVTSPAGTDVRLELGGRRAVCDAGRLDAPGAFGNLPAGEAYIAPVESEGDGVIVFDGSLAGHGVVEKPLRITLRKGRAVAATGEAGAWLLDTLDAGGPNGRTIAELGVGTNPNARVSGRIIEDEKALGTAHLAFGTSASFGGATIAGVHVDGLLQRPTIELDGRIVVRDGERVKP